MSSARTRHDAAARLVHVVNEMNERISTEYHRQVAENMKFAPRILLVGPSGSGKSTLANAVFGISGDEDQAPVRAGGLPCTQQFREYGPFERIPVILIDSKGIEREEAVGQRVEVLDYVRLKNSDRNPCNHVHVAWYVPGEKWEKSDETYVVMLSRVVQVVIVLTKCDLRKQINPTTNKTGSDETHEAILQSTPGVPVIECANPPKGSTHWVPMACPRGHSVEGFSISIRKGTWTCEAHAADRICGEKGNGRTGPYGFAELVDSTVQMVPELFRTALIIAQTVDMKKKNEQAGLVIASHTRIAAGVGAFTGPCSDLPFISGIETALAASLLNIYEVDPSLVSPQTWLQLNHVVIGTVGVLESKVGSFLKQAGLATSREAPLTLMLAPMGAVIDSIVTASIVTRFGCSVAVVCKRFRGHCDPRTAEEFTDSLCNAAKRIQLKSLDVGARTATSMIPGNGRSDALFETVMKVISSWSDETDDAPHALNRIGT